jgi:spore germination protein GerM
MTDRIRARLVGVTVSTAVLFAVAAGCGVPLDDSPRVISRTTTTAAVTSTSGPEGAVDQVQLFFVDEDGGLVGVERDVQATATVQGAIATLLRTKPSGPLDTRIPSETDLLGMAFPETSWVQIDLTSEMDDSHGEVQKQAFAQLVFTALAFPQIDRVSFLIDGTPVAAPTDRGNLDVVTENDYDPPLNPG